MNLSFSQNKRKQREDLLKLENENEYYKETELKTFSNIFKSERNIWTTE